MIEYICLYYHQSNNNTIFLHKKYTFCFFYAKKIVTMQKHSYKRQHLFKFSYLKLN